MRTSKRLWPALTVAAVTGAILAGCTQDPVDVSAPKQQSVPQQKLSKELHARLPDEVKKSGVIVSAQPGPFPPYHFLSPQNKHIGASIELGKAIGQILGVKFKTKSVKSLPGVLSGIEAGRYDMSMGPIGDFPDREKKVDFVDWVQEFVAFAVPKGNPDNIKSLKDVCGVRVAVQAGGSAEEVARQQSKKCVESGQQPVKVKAFRDQNAAILAVRSGRADAFFSSQAPLTYFAQNSGGQLEVAAGGKSNGFDELRQGMVVPKNSELGPVLLDAMKKLVENGTYEKIMKKWDLEAEILTEPGINLATKID